MPTRQTLNPSPITTSLPPLAQGALREGAKQMAFMDKTIDVDRNAGIFVTLNPAGKGYGGRSKLPDNLKQLFRCGRGRVGEWGFVGLISQVPAGLREGGIGSLSLPNLPPQSITLRDPSPPPLLGPLP